MYKKFFFCHIN